jgi:error-prone DNA polymerase
MGFYSPGSLVRDAQKHGVEVRDVSVASSDWDSTLEEPGENCEIASSWHGAKKALRLGFRLIKGFGENAARSIEEARRERPFSDLSDVIRRTGLKKNEVEALAEAGALEDVIAGRRQALWKARAPRTGGLFHASDSKEPEVTLPPLLPTEQLLFDYGRKGLSVNDHPLSHLRGKLRRRKVMMAAELQTLPQGTRVTVAGIVLTRQRPGTASGVVFITLEDETGSANLVLYSGIFEKYHLTARHAVILLARGKVEREVTEPRPGEVGQATPVVHLLVEHLERLDVPGRDIDSPSRDFH